MKETVKWIIWILAGFLMIQQEDLYFATICEIQIGKFNLWEINRLLPSIIIFGLLTGLYFFTINFIVKIKLGENSFNSLKLGIVALVSSIVIYIPLYMNYKFAEEQNIETIYNITGYDMMSGGKYGNDYPSIYINSGNAGKRLPLKGYDRDFVYSKKHVVLILNKGYLGWPIIKGIYLK